MTMTDKELVDMLRVSGELDLKLAADRIEQLNAENDKLVDDCDRLEVEKAELVALVGAMKKLGVEVTDELEMWSAMIPDKDLNGAFNGCFICDSVTEHAPECLIVKAREIFKEK